MTENGEPTTAPISRRPNPFLVFFRHSRLVLKMDSIGREIVGIAFPATLALAADPIASLIDTAFIGHLGAVQLAAVGVSIAIFNQASKVTVTPLVSITTSFVAEENTMEEMKEKAARSSLVAEDSVENGLPSAASSDDRKRSQKKVKNMVSASTALILGLFLGLVQAITLILGSKLLLGIMGVKHDSPMLSEAHKYLSIRALGAPALLLSIAMQSIFRGFKNTTTPLYATVAGSVMNIILDPIFIFVLRLGVTGAAIAHIISQYLMTLILFVCLANKVILMPPNLKDIGRFLKNGFLLLARTVAVTSCQTLAAAMAARLGTVPMAAFQICLQVWLTSSLIADGLAVAGQAILACAFAEKDFDRVTSAMPRVLQMSFMVGLGLALLVDLGLTFGSWIFTKDPSVIQLILVGDPFVAASQPINTLAFVLDGVSFGASDFAYTAYSMIGVAGVSTGAIVYMAKRNGYIGIWIALTIYMGLRAFAGIGRIGTGTGPWKFLGASATSSS